MFPCSNFWLKAKCPKMHGDRNKCCSSDNMLQLTLGTLRCTVEFVSFCSARTLRFNYHLPWVRKYVSLASPGSPPQRQTLLILLWEKFKSPVNIEKQGNPFGSQTWHGEATARLLCITRRGTHAARHLCTCRASRRRTEEPCSHTHFTASYFSRKHKHAFLS